MILLRILRQLFLCSQLIKLSQICCKLERMQFKFNLQIFIIFKLPEGNFIIKHVYTLLNRIRFIFLLYIFICKEICLRFFILIII